MGARGRWCETTPHACCAACSSLRPCSSFHAGAAAVPCCLFSSLRPLPCPFAGCSRSPSEMRDAKRRRSDVGGGEQGAEEGEVPPPPPSAPMDTDVVQANGGSVAADGAPGGSGEAQAADGGEGGEDGGGALELDAELTPEEIMMMQQMGIPFVSC